MLLCFSDREHQVRIRRGFRSADPVFITTSWSAFDDRAAAAECWILVLGWIRSHAAALKRLRHGAAGRVTGVVLVTTKDAENARELKDIRVDEVVWLDEVEHALWPAVQRARARAFLRPIARVIEAAHHLPLQLRQALAYACHSPRPVRGIGELAAVAGCHRRTLWQQWHASAREGRDRLEDFLDWIILMRAVQSRVAHSAWAGVAEELGVHAHTLGRIARRLTGSTLREACGDGIDGRVSRAGERMLRRLLGEGVCEQIRFCRGGVPSPAEDGP